MQAEGRDKGAKRRKNVFEEIEKTEEEMANIDKMARESKLEESKMVQLEEEVQQLREVCNELLRKNHQLEGNQGLITPKPLLKPRDITMLELSSLRGVEGAGRLSVFLSQVEDCTSSNEERQRIVTTRVEPQLAVFIQALMKKYQQLSWLKFKEVLMEELADGNENNMYDAISEMKYQLEDDPMEFVKSLKCKFATLEARSTAHEIPNVVKTIKTKLTRGLPRESRERMQLFQDEHIPLKRFMDRFNMERMVALAQEGEVRRVTPAPAEEAPNSITDRRLEEIEERLRQLNTKQSGYQSDRNYNTSSSVYCPYCRATSHRATECWRRPTPGSCYDCLRPNCRRGQPNCPGRANQRR